MPMLHPATLADLPCIVAIYNQVIPGGLVTADREPVTVAQRLPWFEAHAPERRPIWMVEGGGPEPAGFMSLSDYHPRAAYQITAEVSLYLDSASQGQGLGRRCLAEVELHCAALGIENLVALIFSTNTPSLRLFAQADYSDWGLLPQVARSGERVYDLHILGKRVGG